MTPVKGYTEMKGSGIPWIGEIPCHWDIRRNKTVFSCEKEIVGENSANIQLLSLTTNGIRKKSVDDTSGKVPESYDTYQYVHKDNLVLCLFDLDCSAVFSGLSKYEGMISPAYKVIKCNDNIVPGYADYWFRSVFDGRKFKYLAKNIRYSLTYEDFSALTLPHPPLSEQSAIAAYLDTQCAKIDEIIAQAKASIEDYKQWKASIIYEAVTKGLDSNVKMKDSGIEWIGKVPTHWRVTKIKNFVSIRSGITLGKQYPPGTQLISCPYLRVANVKAEYVDLQDVATIMVTSEEAEKYALKSGELLMTEGGDRDKLGRGTIWHGEIRGCLHQNHVFAVQVNEKYMLTKFLDYLTASPVGREYFDLTAKKTTNLASTNSTTILQFSVPIPPLPEQEKIIAILDRNTATINEVIAEKETLMSDLESYKKSLIYEVVTGKRRVC